MRGVVPGLADFEVSPWRRLVGKPEARALRATAQTGVGAGTLGGALGEGAAGLGRGVQLAGWSSRESEPERRGRASGADTGLRGNDSRGLKTGGRRGHGQQFVCRMS